MTNYLQPDAPTLAISAPAWHEDAACAGIPDDSLWFPRTLIDTNAALAEVEVICGGCPSRTPCLAAAIQGYEKGIWAATTEADRLEMRRRAS